jgi:GDP-D-mannose 3',5'-epimerase
MKTVLVCGAGGFIGSHLVKKLKNQGHKVIGADLKLPEHSLTQAYKFYQLDLRFERSWEIISKENPDIQEVYQLAADMGGAGYIFTGEHDYDIMSNSAQINLHCVSHAIFRRWKVFYSSSACVYPKHNQEDPDNPKCSEDSAYPAAPDSEYGWEKLFSERLYLSANKNYKLDVRIARFHNIFGPEGAWNNGKEKAPAAICRKVAIAKDGETVDVWGSGKQTRSFLYIGECLDAVERLMNSDFIGPVNIGSEEMISINNLVYLVAGIANKNIKISNITGPEGVQGRNSDNALIYSKLGWKPSQKLSLGIEKTYNWIVGKVNESRNSRVSS